MSQCKCPQCYGLAEHMLEVTGKDYGLPKAPGHGAEVVPLNGKKPCDGSMTCGCDQCRAEIAARIARAQRAA